MVTFLIIGPYCTVELIFKNLLTQNKAHLTFMFCNVSKKLQNSWKCIISLNEIIYCLRQSKYDVFRKIKAYVSWERFSVFQSLIQALLRSQMPGWN